jgi:hypothetical protein
MTNEQTNGKEAARDTFFAAAMNTFQRLTNVLDTLADALEHEHLEALANAQKSVPDLNKAVLMILKERHTLHDLERTHGGPAAGIELDLARARDEIELRLACLSEARDAGEVPVGAE